MDRLWLHATALLALLAVVHGSAREHALYEDLMATYDGRERPVANSTHPITIKLGVILQQLIDVDEKNQILTINAWLKYVGWRCAR